MATLNLGKLKINTSEGGIAFRFGEGKVHRLNLRGRGENAAPEYDYDDYNEDYGDYDDREGYGEYDDAAYGQGDYASDDGYGSGAYSGRFGPSDDYADERYDDYENRYDDGYDDGYDDEYADDYGSSDGAYYEDDYGAEGDYDDRYLDEDADAYGDYGSESPLMRYLDENDWVTYALLVVLPPLGIYLLWRRRRFEQNIRMAVSGVSGVWFIILLVLIISMIASGSGDSTVNPPITMTSPTATIEPASSAEADDEDVTDALSGVLNGADASASPDQTQDALALDVTATPIAGVSGTNTTTTTTGNTVIMTATGLYYHNNAECANIEEGAAVSNVTRDVAEQRGKTACPICYPNQEIYYATSGGKYYHAVSDCSDMEGAVQITKDAAVQQGKDACPVCITKTVNSLKDGDLKFADASTTDRSGLTVYATSGGRYYHLNSTCSGMKNASSGSLLKALLAGKKACPTCCSGADTKVWCTEGGTYYHNKNNCSGMSGAYQVSLAEAMVLGKSKCSKCWGSSTVGTIGSGTSSESSDGDSSSGTVYVYGTKNGKYYHTSATCSGMTGASRYTLKSMIASGRAACPTCCAEAETVVYATESGQYYHSYASCSGMSGAQAGTLAQALAYGKSRCPKCWSGSDTASTTSSDSSGSSSTAVLGETASGSYVYCTQNGTYYHTKSSCSGMSGASKVSVSTAVAAGKKACPTCASAANYNVYSTKTGTYYHSKSNCSGMSGASKRTIEEAVILGQSACPVCITSQLKSSSSSTDGSSVSNVTSEEITSSNTYKSGTSGIKVYATASSKHYHTTSTCSGMTDASKITLETALNYGKTACSKCASSANTKVYAVKNGKYYHYTKSCAGDGAVSGNRASALALGLDACPYCVTKTKTEQVTDTYKAGTSGIKVYASVSGKYYHASQSCAGDGASRITLETALNYGKTACSSCASTANKKVYSSSSDKYYHSSKTCAGDDASSGKLDKAVALGKKECPICIGGSEAYEESDIKYSAAGDTNVYIDVDSDMLYYHKNSKCSDAGFSGGTKVMLDFVISWGYKACPFCAPPTSVE